MTRLFNDPTRFRQELIDGFVAAHRRWVRAVPGGVARATSTPAGQVAVVNGGGSGHYPTFAGLVGPGLISGSVMGDLFASPSGQQVASVSRHAEHGGGVLFTYANYAGDVLNFEAGAERLRADGIETSSVVITDDITSAPVAEKEKRRGTAGALAVFKIAGAAAASGADLATVTELASRAKDRVHSIGVAFSGCTLPGADGPLFTLPPGRMGVGIGIHGEPGLSEEDLPSADGLAEFFLDRLFAELPDGVEPEGAQVVPLLNSLGSIRFEELFVVYRRVEELLVEAGCQILEPEVGDLCSSFDMAGVSLSLFWPDDELAELWRAPADAPAYRKGGALSAEPLEVDAVEAASETRIAEGLPASRRSAEVVLAALRTIADVLADHADELGRIDAVAGDGDHGIGMRRGSAAAVEAAEGAIQAGAGAGTTLREAGDAWADRAGGASGALWGVLLTRVADGFGDHDQVEADVLARAVGDGVCAVQQVGKAQVGDKTMIDVLVPLAETLVASEDDLAGAWRHGADIAERAARDTAELLPKIGRARPHAEQSVGTPDAGAISASLVVRAVADVLAR